MPTLATAVVHYLKEVLGIESPGVKPWVRANELPYFLRDIFQFSELELLGQPVVLAIARAEVKQSLSEVKVWLGKVMTWPATRQSTSPMHWPRMNVGA